MNQSQITITRENLQSTFKQLLQERKALLNDFKTLVGIELSQVEVKARKTFTKGQLIINLKTNSYNENNYVLNPSLKEFNPTLAKAIYQTLEQLELVEYDYNTINKALKQKSKYEYTKRFRVCEVFLKELEAQEKARLGKRNFEILSSLSLGRDTFSHWQYERLINTLARRHFYNKALYEKAINLIIEAKVKNEKAKIARTISQEANSMREYFANKFLKNEIEAI